ncbi:hypothetical protein LOTGIDRAFT_96984, partial [Lottia gigantea]
EERLRESASIGDIDTVNRLCDITDINSKNSINGWTALHWAAKRNHPKIVDLLLQKGADKTIANNKGETAQQLTKNVEVLELFGISEHDNLKERVNELPITPNYLANPQFPYVQNNSVPNPNANVSRNAGSIGLSNPVRSSSSVVSSATNGYDGDLVLKARVANMEETDFIEVEFDKQKFTFSELIQLLCAELNVDPKLVHKVRKLPNTIIRNDRDVYRLVNFQEIELVLSNKLKSALP